MKTLKKTNAKRIGVKSTVAYGDGKYAITTFGKGAAAEIALTSADPPEETLPAQSRPELSIHAKFDKARPEPKNKPDFVDKTRISASRSQLETLINNPAESPREDYLGLKDVIEKKFFGRTYPNDTIRVQIAYAILDIQKILGLYVADVLHFIDSLQEKPTDLVGLRLNDEKMKELLAKARPYLGFFGSSEVFMLTKNINEDDNHNAKVFRALGAIRQKLAHFNWNQSLVIFSDSASMPEQFFLDENAEDEERELNTSLWNDVVAPLWRKRIERVRKSFLGNSAKNLWLLYQIFGDDDEAKKKKRARQYYHFSVLKEGKNLGFNITKTRERFIDRNFQVFHETTPSIKREVDTFRSKLYAVLDFIIFEASVREAPLSQMGQTSLWQSAIGDALEQLREAPDDDAKERVYEELAASIENDSLYLRLKRACNFFLTPSNEPTFPQDLRNKDEITPVKPEWLDATNEEDACSFVQLIAFLCNFLEGKEINELVTAFIRKFDGIQSLIDLLRNLEGADAVNFTDTFALFKERDGKMSGKIADELRLLASVGKMKPDMQDAKRVLYKNALAILGVRDEEMTDEWLAENILLDKSRKDYSEKKKDVNPFRNYIAKNVITSRAFYYLVRYAKPTAVRKLMSNPKIIRYVLKRLPETQVNSYYRAVWISNEGVAGGEPKMTLKIDRLTETLSGFSFAVLMGDRNVIVAASRNRDVNVEVERLKKLTALYMSVAYIAVKNLVKVNARYFIAYTALERDLAFFEEKYGKELTSRFDFIDHDNKTRKFRYLSILDFYLARDAETLRRKCEICAEISRLNADYYGLKDRELSRSEKDALTEEDRLAWFAERASADAHTPDEKRAWREKKKSLNTERKACEKKLHFGVRWRQDAKNRDKNKGERPQKWYDILAAHRAELLAMHSTGLIAAQARNDVEHLNTVNKFADYIDDVRRYPEGTPKIKDYHIKSYFEIFHYVRQRAYLEEITRHERNRRLFTQDELAILEEKLAGIRERNAPDKDLLKLEFLPFAYNLARYKNLTTEALFDQDSESGKKLVEQWKERETARRKRNGNDEARR